MLIRAEGRCSAPAPTCPRRPPAAWRRAPGAIVALQRQIVTLTKPVVTQLHGAVRAGGIGIVAASDIAIAADDATFALTEVKLGLAAGDHLAHRPPPDEPAGRGADHASAARCSPAPRRRRTGLVTRAVPADDARRRGGRRLRLARHRRRPGSARVQGILNRDLVARIDERGEELAALSARLFASDEAREAMTAFLSRKKCDAPGSTDPVS